jgi:hypothetical protein
MYRASHPHLRQYLIYVVAVQYKRLNAISQEAAKQAQAERDQKLEELKKKWAERLS